MVLPSAGLLGTLDLVVAVTLGTTVRLIDPRAVSTAVMSVLLMSLIPTFAVPLLIVLHVICIAQARRWKEGEGSLGKRVPANHFGTHNWPDCRPGPSLTPRS